jgi:hypothetical protein
LPAIILILVYVIGVIYIAQVVNTNPAYSYANKWDYVEYFRANKDKADLLKRYVASLKKKI